jgi:hypothetical protein
MEDDQKAERRLWASVIIQALKDATSAPTSPSAEVDKRQAVAWFTASVGVTADNFEAVCLAAEIPPDRVRKFFKAYRGPPLTDHTLSRMRNSILQGDDDAT